MVSRSADPPRGKARTPEQARRLFHAAFVHSLEESGGSINAAARWLKKTPSTVRTWLDGTHRIDCEAVACAPQLWPVFLLCLRILERKNHRG